MYNDLKIVLMWMKSEFLLNDYREITIKLMEGLVELIKQSDRIWEKVYSLHIRFWVFRDL